jgi:hypothetical protein
VHDEVGAAAALQQRAKSRTGAHISGQAHCNAAAAAAAARIMRLAALNGREDGDNAGIDGRTQTEAHAPQQHDLKGWRYGALVAECAKAKTA